MKDLLKYQISPPPLVKYLQNQTKQEIVTDGWRDRVIPIYPPNIHLFDTFSISDFVNQYIVRN